MTIEVLYPEWGNLYGELGNAMYLRRCLPEARFVETHRHDEPFFAAERPDLILMGAMPEAAQEQVIRLLKPYRDRLKALIADDVPMLFTGNAGEVLFETIENWDGSVIPGLDLLPFTAKRSHYDRYNGLTHGVFTDGADSFEVLGFRSQFTFWYGDNHDCAFVTCKRGIGMNPKSDREGIRSHRLIITEQLGPVLINNPELTRKLFSWMGTDAVPAFEAEILQAREARLRDFLDPHVKFTL